MSDDERTAPRLELDALAGPEERELDETLDVGAVGESAWLVKIPSFVLEQWSKQPAGTELGQFQLTTRADQSQEMAILLPDTITKPNTADEIPGEFELQIANSSSRNLFVFGERDVTDQPGHPSFRASVVHECNVTPKLSRAYQQIMQKRRKLAEAPKRSIKTLDSSQAEQNQLAGGLAFVATSRAGFIAPRDRPKGERSVRLPKNELLDILFGMFARSDHLSFLEINREVKQPVVYLRETLNGIATQIPAGPYAQQYRLLPEYRTRATGDDDPDGGSFDATKPSAAAPAPPVASGSGTRGLLKRESDDEEDDDADDMDVVA